MPSVVFHRKKIAHEGQVKPKKRFNWRAISGRILKWVAIITTPILFIGGVYFFIFSTFFTIDFVDVKYDPGVDASRVRSLIFDQMDQKYLQVLSQKNIFLFDEESAKQHVWDTYALDKLVIEKQYPRTLNVTVVGAPFALAWLSGGKWYHIDGKGVAVREIDGETLPVLAKQLQEGRNIADIIKERKTVVRDGDKKVEPQPSSSNPIAEAASPENSVIPIVVNTLNEEVRIGNSLVSQEKVAFVMGLKEKLKEIGIPLLYTRTSSAGGLDITAVTEEGWEIMLNTNDDIGRQIKKVDIILKEKIKEEKKDLQYIDVRFDNRVYYK